MKPWVLYMDNHLVAVSKPAGMLTQADRTGDLSLFEITREWIASQYQKKGRAYLGLLHRLDRPVSGVVVFARTSKAAARLSKQFREHNVRKIYLAIVEGRLDRPEAALESYIARRGARSILMDPEDPGVRQARLTYKVLETSPAYSLLEVEITTGRHHQIRVQLAGLGNPLAGDMRYGSRSGLPGRRIGLHGWRIILQHPTRKEEMMIEAPPPRDWPWPPTRVPG